MKTQHIENVSSIANKYDVYLFDIFGVLHDGEDIFKGPLEIIDNLTTVKKRVFFLTNAPHRSSFIVNHLKQLGLDETRYYGILTAGDQTHYYLHSIFATKQPCIGKTCYFIGNESMVDIVPDGEYTITKDIGSADFILAAGPESPTNTLEQYQDVLARGAKQSIPMLCSNPDLQVFRKGRQEIRAGRLAALYQALGGKVCFYGKPHMQTYTMAHQILKEFRKERMLIIGDSLYTDIVGANRANIDSLICVSKTTLYEIGHSVDTIDFHQFCQLAQKLQNNECIPTYFVHPLQW